MSAPSAQHPDDRPFQHYSWRHRVVAWISQNLFDDFTYTVPHGLLAGMKRKGGLGWVPVKRKASKEDHFLERLDLAGKVAYDVGAFQGLMTMFFAKQARQVIAFEPNAANRKRIEENLALNEITNVVIHPYGLSTSAGVAKLSFDPLMPGAGSIDAVISKTIAEHRGSKALEIELRTLDDEVANGLPAPDFIKIDVEGAELEVLKGGPKTLARRPALFLEMHGETMNDKRCKVAAIVEFLLSVGYESIRHVESDRLITSANSAEAAQGHLYCF
jgi:FkbM family methyltransferase